jgi:hypothetical protein
MHFYHNNIIVLMTHYAMVDELRYSSINALSIEEYLASIVGVLHR